MSVALVFTAGLGSVACGGSKGTPRSAPSTSVVQPKDPSVPTPTTTATSAKTTTSTNINKVVWFAGFKLTVKAATLKTDPDSGVGAVGVAVNFNNQGSDPVRFDGQISLAWGDSTDKFDITTLPTVGAGVSADATLTFSVDEHFRFNGAFLIVGAPDHHQAVIPLSSPGLFVALAPVRLAAAGQVTAGDFRVTVTGGEVRADVARSHLELDRSQEALFLSFDIAWSGSSTYTLGRNNFALALPNGNQVTADEGPIDLLNPGATRTNETVRFTVPWPAGGAYALIVRDPTANRPPAQLPFVLPVTPSD